MTASFWTPGLPFSDADELNLLDFGADKTGVICVSSIITTINANYPTANVRIIVPSGTFYICTSVTSNVNIEWVFQGGSFTLATPALFTILGYVNASPVAKLFNNATAGQGTIKFTSSPGTGGKHPQEKVYAEWWGAVGDNVTDDTAPINAALVASTDIGVKVKLLANIYKANVQFPVSIGTNSNPYPLIQLDGCGEGLTTIVSNVTTSPAIDLQGSGTALTTNVVIKVTNLRLSNPTTTFVPAIKLVGNANARVYGKMENVWIRGNQYNNGGGKLIHLEYHLGFDLENINSDRGHYIIYAANGSNLRGRNIHGRSLSGGFCYLDGAGTNTFEACRLEEGSVATDDTALAAIYLKNSRSNTFIAFSNEGGNSIVNTIYMEGTGLSDPEQTNCCAENRFISCSLASPQRDDVATSVIKEVGNCYDNEYDVFFSSLASYSNTGVGGIDLVLDTNGGVYPHSEKFKITVYAPNASFMTTSVPETVRGISLDIIDQRLLKSTSKVGRALIVSGAGLAGYEMIPGAMFTNLGATSSVTYTLPAALVGMEGTFNKQTNQTWRIDPTGTEIIRAGGAGNFIQLTNIGDGVTLKCFTTGVWDIIAQTYTAYSGSATYDAPNIAVGAQVTTTVSVPGVVVGDSVDSYSFGVSLAGLTVSVYVSAADTVTLVLLNMTAGAIDLASTTIRVRCRKADSPYVLTP